MPATIGYTVRRLQERDGSWLYYGVVRDLATGFLYWAGTVTEDGAAAEREARERLAAILRGRGN